MRYITQEIESMKESMLNECVDDYYSISGEYCGEWVDSKIVKLPVWGDQSVDMTSKDYFEYPGEEEYASFEKDVTLEALDFKAYNLLVAEVGVKLSNGYYRASTVLDEDESVTRVDFDEMAPIRAVGAVASTKAIESLEFYNSDGD